MFCVHFYIPSTACKQAAETIARKQQLEASLELTGVATIGVEYTNPIARPSVNTRPEAGSTAVRPDANGGGGGGRHDEVYYSTVLDVVPTGAVTAPPPAALRTRAPSSFASPKHANPDVRSINGRGGSESTIAAESPYAVPSACQATYSSAAAVGSGDGSGQLYAVPFEHPGTGVDGEAQSPRPGERAVAFVIATSSA